MFYLFIYFYKRLLLLPAKQPFEGADVETSPAVSLGGSDQKAQFADAFTVDVALIVLCKQNWDREREREKRNTNPTTPHSYFCSPWLLQSGNTVFTKHLNQIAKSSHCFFHGEV